jgi:hypothetical protein
MDSIAFTHTLAVCNGITQDNSKAEANSSSKVSQQLCYDGRTGKAAASNPSTGKRFLKVLERWLVGPFQQASVPNAAGALPGPPSEQETAIAAGQLLPH